MLVITLTINAAIIIGWEQHQLAEGCAAIQPFAIGSLKAPSPHI